MNKTTPSRPTSNSQSRSSTPATDSTASPPKLPESYPTTTANNKWDSSSSKYRKNSKCPSPIKSIPFPGSSGPSTISSPAAINQIRSISTTGKCSKIWKGKANKPSRKWSKWKPEIISGLINPAISWKLSTIVKLPWRARKIMGRGCRNLRKKWRARPETQRKKMRWIRLPSRDFPSKK